MNNKGFTLVELLVYMALFAIIAALLTSVLLTSTRVQVHEEASNELSNQLNFTLQTIQRLVRESSNIEVATNGDNPDTPFPTTESAYLKLRMPNDADDPTCIVLLPDATGNGAIAIVKGHGVLNQEKCRNEGITATNRLTTDKVSLNLNAATGLGLSFDKFSNAPGHDSVQVNLSMSRNSATPGSQLTRSLQTAIGRASAATFDSGVFPNADNSIDLGLLGTRWRKLFTTDIDVSGTINQGGNYDANTGGRGLMVVGVGTVNNGETCDSICANHTGSCFSEFRFSLNAGVTDLVPRACDIGMNGQGGLCLCQ